MARKWSNLNLPGPFTLSPIFQTANQCSQIRLVAECLWSDSPPSFGIGRVN
jgi:hypothetical protein